MNAIQTDLFTDEMGAEQASFLAVLRSRTWVTRSQLARLLGWDERTIRKHAAALGPELVKGQLGFCLLSRLPRTDIGHALRAADAEISQGKKMLRYALGLKRNIHRITGGL